GFSFGARVGMEVGIADDRVLNLISIGTPVDKYDFSFLTGCRKPILFVHGSEDEFGEVPKLQTLAGEVAKNAEVQLSVIAGADHFFAGHLAELKEVIGDWIKRRRQSRVT